MKTTSLRWSDLNVRRPEAKIVVQASNLEFPLPLEGSQSPMVDRQLSQDRTQQQGVVFRKAVLLNQVRESAMCHLGRSRGLRGSVRTAQFTRVDSERALVHVDDPVVHRSPFVGLTQPHVSRSDVPKSQQTRHPSEELSVKNSQNLHGALRCSDCSGNHSLFSSSVSETGSSPDSHTRRLAQRLHLISSR